LIVASVTGWLSSDSSSSSSSSADPSSFFFHLHFRRPFL
jgi:hypothetical protein